MTSLMDFVLNSLKPRVNNPANAKLWLPALLWGMNDAGKRILPINASNQDLGYLANASGAYVAGQFAADWAIFNQENAIPDPDFPYPALKLPDVTLDGLQNLTVGNSHATLNSAGYDVTIDLLFNLYSGTIADVPLPQLTISGKYAIRQALLVGPDKPVDKNSLAGDGDFTVVLTDARMIAKASITITGVGPTRSNAIVVSALQLAGVNGPTPTLNFTHLTLDQDLPQKDALLEAIQDALNDPEGQAAFVTAAAAILNAPGNLGSVNKLVSGQAGGVLNDIFSPLPPQGLPVDGPDQRANTPVDQYLFDRVRLAFAEIDSNWFLPWQLITSDDPTLDPYANPHVSLPDQTIKGLSYTNIVITDILLSGASNASAPLDHTVLAMDRFSTRVRFGELPQGPNREVQRPGGPVQVPVPPAPPVTFTGDFSLTQQGFRPVPLTGTIRAAIGGAAAAIVVVPSGPDVDQMNLDLSQVTADTSNATITVTVALDPPNSGLEQILDVLFAKPDVQDQILHALNKALAEQGSQISSQITQIARTAIARQLGG